MISRQRGGRGLLLVLLAAASAVLAHGGDHGTVENEPAMAGMGGGMAKTLDNSNSNSITHQAETPPSYFTHQEHIGLLYTHIVLMSLAWVFVLPVMVMFSIVRSRWTQLMQLVFLIVNGLGLFVGIAYNASTPDLYPGNIHNSIGWIVSIIVDVQIAVGFLGRLVGILANSSDRKQGDVREAQSFMPVKQESHSDDWQYHDARAYRPSHDSGHGTDLASRASSARHSVGNSTSASSPMSTDMPPFEQLRDDTDNEDLQHAHFLPSPPKDGRLAKLLDAALKLPKGIWRILSVAYNLIDRVVVLLSFTAMCTGLATYGRFFEGHEIYNGLAHWIKGGVFFWFGIIALARWCGSFGDLGWAWNVRPKSGRWQPTPEFVESALIFFYGITNMFLEHLGSSGEWSYKDLEHVSIAALFLGGGLLGMLVDSTHMRFFLNTTVEEAVSSSRGQEEEVVTVNLQPPESYEFSLNPIPALVVLLVGQMMSAHSQSDMNLAMIHKLWGKLLFAASCARMATYVLVYLKPPKSVLPSRPPTELLTAFCLMSGGLVFMESAQDVVNGMEHYDVDVMFVYTVSMGVVALLMAWITTVLVLKGWATRRERSSQVRVM